MCRPQNSLLGTGPAPSQAGQKKPEFSLFHWTRNGGTFKTDSRSQRIRASRRGGQLLTRALSSSYVTGLPVLCAPSAPRPDALPYPTPSLAASGQRAPHTFIPDTNLLERLLGEGRRRTKVIPHFWGERSCLTLVYATLVAAAKKWRGVRLTPAIQQQLAELRAQYQPAVSEVVA